MRGGGIIFGGVAVRRKRIENAILIGVPLLGSVFAIDYLVRYGALWSDIASFLIFYVLTGIGVALGLHRYFSHRSFETGWLFSSVLAALGTMAFQGSIERWVSDHRRHHVHADETGDVHSPHVDSWGADMPGFKGFLHAHIGWMFDNTATDLSYYGRGLRDDPVVDFFTRTHWLWLILSLGLPYIFGWLVGGADAAFSSLLTGGFLRTAVLHNVVWSVNSIGHRYGRRDFEQSNESRNNLALALLTFGDGWHNNHHRFPRSYRHGLQRHEIDLNAAIIRLLERMHVVWNVVRIPEHRQLAAGA